AGVGRLRVAMEMSGDGAKDLVAAKVGLALMMRCQVAADLAAGKLAAIPLADMPSAQFVLVYRSQQELSRPAAELVDLIRHSGAFSIREEEALSTDGLALS